MNPQWFDKPQYFILSFIIIFTWGCAKVVGPPGGPKDETSPKIISTMPLADAVNIPNGNNMEIRFSEGIEKKSIEGAVFIAPRPAGEIRYSWKGEGLKITLPDSFANNTTYVVTLGATIRDLRGNRMENSYTFAFSTGEEIDRGKITGTVFQDDKPATGVSICLYDYSIIDSIDYLDSLYPPYFTQSGKEGEFELSFLPDGKYLPLAFIDKNKNQLFDYPGETFGLSDRPVLIVRDSVAPHLNFRLSDKDTSSISIISAAITTDRLIKTRFNRAISCDLLAANLDEVYLQPSDSQLKIIPASGLREYSGGEVAVFNLYFADIAESQYRLKVGRRFLDEHERDTSYMESSEFTVRFEPDDSPPVLDYFSHGGLTVFPDDSILEFSFSEPVEIVMTADSSVLLYDADENTHDFTYNWLSDFQLDIIPADLKWSTTYYLRIKEDDFADLSGNIMGDSVRFFNFSTYDSDSLGEVSGNIVIDSGLISDGNIFLTFVNASGPGQFTRTAHNRKFNFRLPPGKYLLSGFLDSNDNGKYDFGSLIPFKFSETVAVYPDTIRIRSRFETAGIKFEFK